MLFPRRRNAQGNPMPMEERGIWDSAGQTESPCDSVHRSLSAVTVLE
jgi:hypothetical protein